MSTERPPFPPFTLETARQKVRGAEDGWNTCNPERVSLAYSEDSHMAEPQRVPAGASGHRCAPRRGNGSASWITA